MEKVRQLIAFVRQAYGRLGQQEQLTVLGGGAAAITLVLFLVVVGLSHAVGRAEHRVKVKTDQLAEVLQLQGEYRARAQEREARLRELGRSNVRLVSLVEDAAKQAGVDIGQLRPEEGQPTAEGVIESTVDLRATNLSIDRVQDFLSRIEKTPGVVITRRVRLSRPFKRDTLDLELTVTTFKLKS